MRTKSNVPTLPVPELRLYHSKRKCERFLAKHGIKFEPIESTDAQTWMFTDDEGPHAVVLYEPDLHCDYCADIGMLSHEATHIALFALDYIGEDIPAEEETCYMVQAVTTALCEMHFRWKEKRLIQSDMTT